MPDYNILNKDTITKDIMLMNEVEYENSLVGLASENMVDKMLKDITILKQQIVVIEGDIANMETDVAINRQAIALANQQISTINTRLGIIDLILYELQTKMEEKANVTEIERLDERIDNIDVDVDWEDITSKPTAFQPTAHIHSEYTKTYHSLSSINSSFTTTTSIKDVVTAMENNSIAFYSIDGTRGNYPTTYATVKITKSSTERNYVECVAGGGKTSWVTSYHVTENPSCDWIQVGANASTGGKGELLTLADLGLVNADFSPTDADGNIKKIIDKMGAYKTLCCFIYDDYKNLDDSLTAFLNVGKKAWTLHITTATDTYVPSPIYLYANGAKDAHLLTYDNTLQISGAINCEKKIAVTSEMLKNEWKFYGDFQNALLVGSNSIKVNLMIKGGTGEAYSSLVEGIPTVPKNATLSCVTDSGKVIPVCYKTNGTISLQGTVGTCSWCYVHGEVIF